MKRVRVLVVDDSALMRRLLTGLLEADSHVEVVGTATDPIEAFGKLDVLRPDVLTLDVEMPRMDGIRFLEHLMKKRPMPVVMVSTLTVRGCDVTLRALELGAVDFVTKPAVDVIARLPEIGGELVRKVRTAATATLRRPTTAVAAPAAAVRRGPLRAFGRFVAIGASTGGTEALRAVLTAMPEDAPPIVVVQHMPALFTRQFAERLDKLSRIRVSEARDGDILRPGHALIAPGGELHAEVARAGAGYAVRLVPGPPVGHHRPSVDALFASCARIAGSKAVGAILTGMGADGARGLLAMRGVGARTLAEHEKTCVVYGMPRAAVECGAAETVVPLDRMAAALLRAADGHDDERVVEGAR